MKLSKSSSKNNTSKSDNCQACAFCYMEPGDMNFVCGHKDAGIMGLYIHHAVKEGGHCGPNRPKFKQHPLRNPNGTLKSSQKL